ncbi:unnamed protein product, partial [Larinioides sclopetarius]
WEVGLLFLFARQALKRIHTFGDCRSSSSRISCTFMSQGFMIKEKYSMFCWSKRSWHTKISLETHLNSIHGRS